MSQKRLKAIILFFCTIKAIILFEFFYFLKICLVVCHVAQNNWAMWHSVSFGVLFKCQLTKGPISIFLQSAGT